MTSLLRFFYREPDFYIGGKEHPYMLRWWVIPRNRWFNVYLHKILRDDDDRALHDHPWPTVSFVLSGAVRETYLHIPWTAPGLAIEKVRILRSPNVVVRGIQFRHRLELVGGRRCWTLFLTGPVVRVWGFWCPQGFVPWHDFVDQEDHGNVGRGCGETT